MKTITNIEPYLFALLTSLLILLEVIASELSYENYGWISPLIIYAIIVLNIIPIILFVFSKKILATILIIIIGLIIIPDEFILTYDLLKLKEEAANIVNYSYRIKISTGKFPNDISSYNFTHEELKEKIKYTKYKDEENFMVWYFVGTRSTDHFYRHGDELGKWYFNDD